MHGATRSKPAITLRSSAANPVDTALILTNFSLPPFVASYIDVWTFPFASVLLRGHVTQEKLTDIQSVQYQSSRAFLLLRSNAVLQVEDESVRFVGRVRLREHTRIRSRYKEECSARTRACRCQALRGWDWETGQQNGRDGGTAEMILKSGCSAAPRRWQQPHCTFPALSLGADSWQLCG